MDFYQIKERSLKNGTIEIYPDFKICRSRDLMVRGKSFYAIWDKDVGLWSTDEYDVQRLIDKDLIEYAEERKNNLEEKCGYIRTVCFNIFIYNFKCDPICYRIFLCIKC